MLYFWTVAVTSLAECLVSVKRIEDFLLLPEGKNPQLGKINFAFSSDENGSNEKSTSQKISKVNTTPQKISKADEFPSDKCVIFKNTTAKWSAENESGIIGTNFAIHEKQLITISGPGKPQYY